MNRIKIRGLILLFGFAAFAVLVLQIPVNAQPAVPSETSLPYVDAAADFITVIRPHELTKSNGFRELRGEGGEYFEKVLDRLSETHFKLTLSKLEEIEQITTVEKFGNYSAMTREENKDKANIPYRITIIKTVDNNSDRFELATHSVSKTLEYKGKTYYYAKSPDQRLRGYMCIVEPDTVVFTDSPTAVEVAIDAGASGPKSAPWHTQWMEIKNKPISFVFGKSMFSSVGNNPVEFKNLPIEIKSLQSIQFAIGQLQLGKECSLVLDSYCDTDEHASKLKVVADRALEIVWNAIQVEPSRRTAAPLVKQTMYHTDDGMERLWQRARDIPALVSHDSLNSMVQFAHDLVKSTKTSKQGKLVRLEAKVRLNDLNLKAASKETFLAIKRYTASRNLIDISTAFHNFHDSQGCFPASVYVSESGKKYSWRIRILPFIDGGAAIYKQYRFDEDWDSPHNLQVTSQMPDIFRSDMDDKKTTNTSWLMLTGPEGAFDGTLERSLMEIGEADGMGKTIMAVEANREVHWAKPEDIVVDPKTGIPDLGGYHEGGFHVAFTDTTVRFIDEKLSREILWDMFTYNGGKDIDFENLIIKDK